MAKESMKAREVKRAKLVAKYAAKRQALKEAGDWAALDKLPKNSAACHLTELDTADAEHTHISLWTSSERTTVVHTASS